jgi:hypothetical protein
MADITWKTELYDFGTEKRERLSWVSGSGLRSGNPTARLTGSATPQPLSQYPLGADIPGYRLEHTERGHIIGLQFGGPEHKCNLVPMYAGYNGGSGGWGQMEQKVRRWLDSGMNRALGMNVSIGYDRADSAIPSNFGFSFHSQCAAPLPGQFGGFHFHVHPPACISFDELDEGDLVRLDILKRSQKLMMAEKWFVETSGAVQLPGSGRSLRSGTTSVPLAVGGVALDKFDLNDPDGLAAAYASRPYAVLDYLWFKHQEIYINHLNFGLVTRFDNTEPFSEVQKSAVRKLNILAHLGYMVSDLFAISDQENYHTLFVGSADASAQVDHITGKSGAGSNCFSNARLVSKVMNIALNRTGMQERINAYYENKANWKALHKRFQQFWTGL